MTASELEEDVRLWCGAGGSRAAAETAFRARHGAAAEERLARAARAIAWLKTHRVELEARGVLSLGEGPADIHLAPSLAAALARALG